MKKIRSRVEIEKICRQLHRKGKRIVFTNGCFDILHAGHVQYLEKAKSLGDVLVVGLNSDRSVSGLKPGRPINTQKNRATVLAGLGCVDHVVIFRESTPYRLIQSVLPDVLVKGGDWKKDQIVGSDIAKKTLSLRFVKGLSTTRLIGKIRKSSC